VAVIIILVNVSNVRKFYLHCENQEGEILTLVTHIMDVDTRQQDKKVYIRINKSSPSSQPTSTNAIYLQ
jgi:hypothetical protein